MEAAGRESLHLRGHIPSVKRPTRRNPVRSVLDADWQRNDDLLQHLPADQRRPHSLPFTTIVRLIAEAAWYVKVGA